MYIYHNFQIKSNNIYYYIDESVAWYEIKKKRDELELEHWDHDFNS
jgi:hypothetical protein